MAHSNKKFKKNIIKAKGHTVVEVNSSNSSSSAGWLVRLLGARFKFFGCATNVFAFLIVFLVVVALAVCYFVWWR